MPENYEREERDTGPRQSEKDNSGDEHRDTEKPGRPGWGGHDPRASYQGADRGEDYGRAGYREESSPSVKAGKPTTRK